MHIARFCTPSSSLERYGGKLSWKTGHAYSVIGRMQVQKNWTSSQVPRPERLSWDKLYRRFLAFLMMESMWQFHFKSLETLRPSILPLINNSIGMPLTTTESNEVAFLVLKFMRSSLYFVSFSWNFSAVAWLTRVSECSCLGSYLSSPRWWYCRRISRDRSSSLIMMINSHGLNFVPWLCVH